MGERFRRVIVSVHPRFGLMVLAIAATVLLALPRLYITSEGVAKMSNVQYLQYILWGILVLAVLVLGLSTFFEYRRRTHDWTLIFQYADTFDEMTEQRVAAARFLLDKTRNLEEDCGELEDILDIFEDMGFYIEGDQLSSEVVHHTFDYWIRAFCQAAESYIKDRQRKEPLQWGHLDGLRKCVDRIEIRKLKKLGKKGDTATTQAF